VFGISGFELLVIGVFVLIVFGPDKLPEVGKTIGNAIRLFKNAQADMERVIRVEMNTDAFTDPREVEAAEKAKQASEAGPSKAAISAWATDEHDEEEEDEE
jgi:TatA/E family protein of Tat protein translocase